MPVPGLEFDQVPPHPLLRASLLTALVLGGDGQLAVHLGPGGWAGAAVLPARSRSTQPASFTVAALYGDGGWCSLHHQGLLGREAANRSLRVWVLPSTFWPCMLGTHVR